MGRKDGSFLSLFCNWDEVSDLPEPFAPYDRFCRRVLVFGTRLLVFPA